MVHHTTPNPRSFWFVGPVFMGCYPNGSSAARYLLDDGFQKHIFGGDFVQSVKISGSLAPKCLPERHPHRVSSPTDLGNLDASTELTLCPFPADSLFVSCESQDPRSMQYFVSCHRNLKVTMPPLQY